MLTLIIVFTDAALSDKVKWFEGQFYSLQESAQAELTRKGVTVQDFRQSLARLSSSIKAEHEKFVKEKYDTFQKAKSIEEIFVHLNFYLGFIDFSLLEHIIDHFGSSDLKTKMSQYSMDMVQFRKTTTVTEILPHLSGRPEPPPEYVKLEMEFDYDPHTYTLEDLEQARIKLGREFSLSKLALFLVKIVTGSVVLVCILPEGMVWGACANSTFLDLKLVRLHLNDECIYHIDLSRMFAHNINNEILSTPDSRGLAIIISLFSPIPSRQISDRYNNNILSTLNSCGLATNGSPRKNDRYRWLRNRFKDCNFALYIHFDMDKLELDGIVYAVSHYLKLPNISNYPILFFVKGKVSQGDVNTLVTGRQGDVNTLVTGHDEIDIGKDIIEPLISSEHLVDNPKMIIIEEETSYRDELFDLSQLRIPHGQNFIVALFNSNIDENEHFLDIFVEWRIHRSKMIDIEERLLRLESQKFKAMIVRSHLEQPIYVYPVS